VIARETVGQVLVFGDPHDVWIVDDDVSPEPLLPACAILGEKEEFEICAGNDRVGTLTFEDVLEASTYAGSLAIGATATTPSTIG
jgi:hypothetical protein